MAIQTVPREIALKLCVELQQSKWYTMAHWQCWGCIKFGGTDPTKMCGQIVGCNQVVARYRRMQAKHSGNS